MAQRKVLTLSIPRKILKEVDAFAEKEKLTKSELFRMAITDLLGRLKWEKASESGRKKAREMKITEEDIEDIIHDFRKK
ncbi:MAG: ribbon-helix-helix protein, CopG family [Candidatus Margulisiibacteriota bacterium]